MLTMKMMTLFNMVVSGIVFCLAYLLSEKTMKEREKMTPFECGFSPFKKARNTFSLRFFMITLIFLIFDMEIALILPIGLLMEVNSKVNWAWAAVVVVFILLIGVIHEWKNGALNWMD